MKVLSATGIEKLDQELLSILPQHGITVVGDCCSRLVLTKVAEELKADTVIISPQLKNGENDLVQVIVSLRERGIRVIVLPGHPQMAKTQELIKKLVPYGVYDYVYDKVGVENIIERLMKPAAPGDIPKHLIDAAAMQRVGDEIKEEIKRQLPENGDVKIKNKPVSIKLTGKNVSKKIKINKETEPGKSPKLTIMLATGDDSINESISTSHPCRPVIAVSRESLLEKVPDVNPDIIILSYMLPGELDILEVVYQVKEITDKVIYLSGNIPDNDITLVRIMELGVEVLTGDASIGAIMRATCRLSGMSEKQYNVEELDQEEGQEGTITRLARVGTELARNIPNISVPKIRISKKADVNEKLIAVVSPLAAGKTFVSVNLSTVLAGMGYTVALVDGDARQQSIHSWLNMGEDETGLADAVNSCDPLINAFQHQMVPNLYVFGTDPYMDKPYTVNTKGLLHLFESLQEETDIIIVDTSRYLNDPLNRFIVETAASVILVADVDYSRLLRLQAELDKLESSFDFNKFSLMVNRAITCDNIDPSDSEKAAGLAADGILPEKAKETLESIKNGIPAALFCPDIKQALIDYWERRVS